MQIKSAIKGRMLADMSHKHFTTIDFGQIFPINHLDMIIGDKANYKYDVFSRLSPLNFPVYGDFSLRTFNVFVPYYQLAEEVEGFFSGQKMYHGIPTTIRYCNLRDIMLMFTTDSYGLCSAGTESDFNFAIISSRQGSTITSKPNYNYYKLTSKGRYVYKVLRSFGYDFPANVDLSSILMIQTQADKYLGTKLNILPLLAFFKAYNDWMTNSVHYNSSSLTKYLQAIKTKDDTLKLSDGSTSVCGKNGAVPAAALVEMFDQVRLLYDSDYFTSAWRFPNDPDSMSLLGGNDDPINADPYLASDSNEHVYHDRNSTRVTAYGEFASETDDYVATLSARQLNFLRAFDNWVRRNNYAGSRAVNQIYARFGLKPSEFRAQYADFISKDSIPLRVGDVTQTSQTSSDESNPSPLGSFAGKGIANGDHSVSYQANDYGMLMTLAYVWVDPIYYRGFHRNVLKTDPLDFYNPEFDGVGPEPISYLELWNDPKSVVNYPVNNATRLNDGNKVFGFTERYNDMRFQRDQITGDFELYDMFKPWHFGRDLNDIRNNLKSAQSDSVVYYTPTTKGDYEYDRIFATTQYSDKAPVEHFYLQCQFQGSVSRPMKNISSAADLGDGDLTIDRLGQQVS